MGTSEQPPVRWGILGTGSIAATFTEDLLILDDHLAAAVGSRDGRRARDFATKYGIDQAYGSYEELASDDSLDVVYVATPHSEHAVQAKLCLRAGRGVLVEKPFTVTAAEAAEVIALACEQRRFAMEAMWTRFNPLVREIRDLVAGEAIGQVTAIQADLSGAPPYQPEHRLWNPDLAGGALLDLGVYPVSFGSMLLGEPDAVRAVAALAPTGVDANTAVTALYPGGAVGLYHCGLWATSPRIATITGTGGRITTGAPFYRPDNFTIDPDNGEPRTRSIILRGHGYTYQAEEVARCLREGLTESPVMPLADTLSVMRTLDAARADYYGASPPIS